MRRASPSGARLGKVVNAAKRRSAQALLFLMLVASVGLLLSAKGFQTRLDDIRAASTDNQSWVVAQLEVDHQNLVLQLDAAALAAADSAAGPGGDVGRGSDAGIDAADLREIKRAFDVFYSRVDVFASTMHRLPLTDETASKVSRLVATRDALAQMIDAIPAPDAPAILEFRRAVLDAATMVRSMAVIGLQQITQATAAAREEEAALFVRFFVQSLVLFLLVALGTFLVVRIWRELEQRSRETERVAQMLSTAFDSTLNAVIVSDTASRVLYSNEMAQRMFGYAGEDILGMDARRVLPGGPGEDEGPMDLIGKGPTVTTCRKADGQDIPVEVSMAQDQDINGQPIVIAFIRDISDQVEAERNLRDALKQAEQAAQAKSMFLATMSHEMRTPLHGLMASLGLIESSDLSPENRDLLKTARDCSARALVQVDDVLELTRLGEGRETPEFFDPARIAADIVDELRPLAANSSNRIEMVAEGPLDDFRLEGLPIAFARALYNLAGNAVKFTQNGIITLRLTLDAARPGDLSLKVAVEDTGIGIAPEDQARIFENFETADRSEINSKMGSGLGLPIARLAVERQGGALTLDSTLGRGSTFSFIIPVKAQERPARRLDTAPQGELDDAPLGPKTVLVVDDNEVNLTLMTEMVRRMGHQPHMAMDGQEALDKARITQYDYILMDFSMPVMDGPTSAREIRASNGPSAGAVIIGVTALIEASGGHGRGGVMDEVLIKPVSQQQLERAMKTTRHHRTTASDPLDTADVDRIALEEARQGLADLAEMVGRDTALRLLRATILDADTAVAAMSAHDMPLAEKGQVIHKAVGSTGLLNFGALSETLSDAEAMTLAKRDPAGSVLPAQARRLIDEIRRAYMPVILAAEAEDAGEETAPSAARSGA
ncbi:hybrid sensor histidine kinase/response regulator [Roseovarius aquimarinus]|uniref:histidine kinase n=1 Tax=Roseovarius aquimarinus TaxID=1229156 RepID=A0ABW7I591_9RHOB